MDGIIIGYLKGKARQEGRLFDLSSAILNSQTNALYPTEDLKNFLIIANIIKKLSSERLEYSTHDLFTLLSPYIKISSRALPLYFLPFAYCYYIEKALYYTSILIRKFTSIDSIIRQTVMAVAAVSWLRYGGTELRWYIQRTFELDIDFNNKNSKEFKEDFVLEAIRISTLEYMDLEDFDLVNADIREAIVGALIENGAKAKHHNIDPLLDRFPFSKGKYYTSKWGDFWAYKSIDGFYHWTPQHETLYTRCLNLLGDSQKPFKREFDYWRWIQLNFSIEAISPFVSRALEKESLGVQKLLANWEKNVTNINIDIWKRCIEIDIENTYCLDITIYFKQKTFNVKFYVARSTHQLIKNGEMGEDGCIIITENEDWEKESELIEMYNMHKDTDMHNWLYNITDLD